MAETLCSRCTELQLSGPEKLGAASPEVRIRDPDDINPLETVPDSLIETGYVLHDTFPGFPRLVETARLGCPVCKLFAEAARQDLLDQDPDEPDWPLTDDTQGLEKGLPASVVAVYRVAAPTSRHALETQMGMLSSLDLRFTIDVPGDRCYSPVLSFAISTKSNCAIAQSLGIQRRSLASTTLTPENTSMIRSWVEECRNGHENETGARSDICWTNGAGRTTDPAPPRPRRLIYVGGSREGDESDIPRLVETNGRDLPYAALSYCWGKGEWLQTKKETLWERKEGILWDVLPRCHRDACIITRILGLDYVWIDALCIVQNDGDDWEHEAALMGPIYQAAYVTICAVKSASSDDSFLYREVPPRQPSHKDWKQDVDRYQELAAAIPYHDPARNISGHYSLRYLSLLAKSHPHVGGDCGSFSAEVEESVWNTRGWTLQERRLSSRTIFFGAASILFECQAFSRCEAFPSLTRIDRPWQDVALVVEGDRHAAGVLLRTAWTNLSMRLCRRQFTFRKDILPAMAATSTRFGREMQLTFGSNSPGHQEPVRCVAGMWNVCLRDDLLWICRGFDSRFHAPRSEGVPTWSWLSLRTGWAVAGEWMPHGNKSHVFKNEAGYAVLDSQDSSPDGAAPYLTPICDIIRIPETIPNKDHDTSLWLRGPIAQHQVSCRRGDTALDFTPVTVNGIRIEIAFDSDWRLPRQRGLRVQDPDKMMDMSLYLAGIFRKSAQPEDTAADRIYGLVLSPLPDAGSGKQLHRLRRIGVFRADDEEEARKSGRSEGTWILGTQLNFSEEEFHVW